MQGVLCRLRSYFLFLTPFWKSHVGSTPGSKIERLFLYVLDGLLPNLFTRPKSKLLLNLKASLAFKLSKMPASYNITFFCRLGGFISMLY